MMEKVRVYVAGLAAPYTHFSPKEKALLTEISAADPRRLLPRPPLSDTYIA
jgi:hypothetical protein